MRPSDTFNRALPVTMWIRLAELTAVLLLNLLHHVPCTEELPCARHFELHHALEALAKADLYEGEAGTSQPAAQMICPVTSRKWKVAFV